MKRLMMSLTGFSIGAWGLVLAGPHRFEARPLAVILSSWLWAGLEIYIGLFRSFEGKVPSHLLSKLSRLAWPLPLVYAWLDFRFGWTAIRLPGWVFLLLFGLFCFGLFFRGWAVFYLGPSFSYDLKRPAGGELVRTGPYRLVRHPSYLGICLLGSLPGLLLGSLPGFLGLALFTAPQTVFRARREDELLEREFGPAFREYARRVALILPFLY